MFMLPSTRYFKPHGSHKPFSVYDSTKEIVDIHICTLTFPAVQIKLKLILNLSSISQSQIN